MSSLRFAVSEIREIVACVVGNHSNIVAFTCGFCKFSDGRGVARSTCLAFARAMTVLEISTTGPTTDPRIPTTGPTAILIYSTFTDGKCEIESDMKCDYVQPQTRQAKRHRCLTFRLPVCNPNCRVRHAVRHRNRTNHQFIEIGGSNRHRHCGACEPDDVSNVWRW